MKILIIEDDADIGELLVYLIETLGHEVVLSRHLLAISDILKIHPHLILLDHKLTDGLGGVLCKKIKKTAALKNVPLIMLSASNDAAKIAKECGADDCISKPFDINKIEEKIGDLLKE